ncbi:argininosuccinate lyase [Candidatus Roizmanbacteria bacterium]|nr:argininosuccinate lyase [Candidatus Roizmanbacteria bacterium]
MKANNNPFWGAGENKNFGKVAIEYAAGQDVILDKRFIQNECLVDQAHILMLLKQKIITYEIAKPLLKTIEQIKQLDKKGKFELKKELEDVHSNIEKYVIQKLGVEVGGYLRLGIARNDQIYTDTIMYLKEHLLIICNDLLNTVEKVVLNAKNYTHTIMPGYTHLRISQPITVGHWLTAKAYHLLDDVSSLLFTIDSIDKCPLGIVEMAGTHLPLDRKYLSDILGFRQPTENTLYTANQRGENEIKVLAQLSLLALHIRRIIQELLIFSSTEFNLVEIDDLYVTGGTAQPNLRNPDTLEVVRGNCPRIYSKFFESLMIMDIQTSGYNRDTQQTKPSFLEGLDLAESTAKVFGGILTSMKFNKKRMLEVANLNFATAPDVSTQICIKGKVSFREAYSVVKTLIKEKYLKKSFSELTPKLIAEVSKKVLKKEIHISQQDLIDVASASQCVFSHTCEGGPAPSQVKLMIKDINNKIIEFQENINKKQNHINTALRKLEKEVNLLIKN